MSQLLIASGDRRPASLRDRRPGLDLTEFMVGGHRDRLRPPPRATGSSWWI